MKSIILAMLAAVAAPAVANPAPAQVSDAAMGAILSNRARDAVEAMSGRKNPNTVFTAAFIAAVPPAKLRELAEQLVAAHGPIVGQDSVAVTAPWAARFNFRLKRATAIATLQLEAGGQHRISGFRITSVTPLADSLDAITAEFAALPGTSGFSIARLGEAEPMEIAGKAASQHFAIGSSFKLWVLEALAEQIRLGKRQWSDVVPLGPPSLPSGIMQDWPQGSSVTLETLATLMISRSDNTATDTLIRLLGREAIEQRLIATGVGNPLGMTPFLTTLEAFTLKSGGEAEKAAWAAANPSARRGMLAALGPNVDAHKIDWSRLETGRPNAIDAIEWFATPRDVVRVLDALRRQNDPRAFAILGILPMLPDERRTRFGYTGYKGGSEAGVIALNWLLRSKSGQYYAVAASWNNTDAKVDEARFAALAQRLTDFVE